MRHLKKFTALTLMGAALVVGGCERGSEKKVESGAREVGQDIRRTTENVGENVKNAAEGLKDGIGGSGPADDADIGKREGVLKDGEGPLENPETRPGKNPGIINDGEGPIEERRR